MEGVNPVKKDPSDDWDLHKIQLENGLFLVIGAYGLGCEVDLYASKESYDANGDPIQEWRHNMKWE